MDKKRFHALMPIIIIMIMLFVASGFRAAWQRDHQDWIMAVFQISMGACWFFPSLFLLLLPRKTIEWFRSTMSATRQVTLSSWEELNGQRKLNIFVIAALNTLIGGAILFNGFTMLFL